MSVVPERRSNDMRTLHPMLVGGLVIALGGRMLPEAAGADNKDKIVGSWQFVKATSSDGKDVPVSKSVTLEFTKAGKVNITIKGNPKVIDGGTYEVTGDELKLTGPDKNAGVSKIKTLTDTVLILEDKKGDVIVTTELKRK
jgi:uncharacterized protein (TIGR03066 family)